MEIYSNTTFDANNKLLGSAEKKQVEITLNTTSDANNNLLGSAEKNKWR